MKLALGTVQFGLNYGIANKSGQVARSEVRSMLQLALESGIDCLDTAVSYGDSELCLGEVGTAGFNLITKLPAIPENCGDADEWVKEMVSGSLLRLGVQKVYGLLLHRSEELLGKNGYKVYKAIKVLKEEGKVQKWGVSIYSTMELKALHPRFRFDIVQAPFNLLDRRLFNTGWMRRLKDENIEIHTRSTFLQGLLLTKPESIPVKFAPWGHILQKWHRWLEENNRIALQECLTFSITFPEIDRVIVGVDNMNHLQQIISAAECPPLDIMPDLGVEDENLLNPTNWTMK